MPQPRRSTIVVVEDDVSLLGALVFALEADGFSVAPYGRAGPLLSAPVQADCMVVDMRLPDMDGLTVIARLRERGIRAPTILTITNPDSRTRLSAIAMGVWIVEKPLITGELLGRINELIAASGR